MAGIMALAATQQFYSEKEAATRVIPALAPLLIDADARIREQGSCL
jgi:hypothetical protein